MINAKLSKTERNRACGELIRKIRLTACLTQKEFAAEIGTHTLSVTFYELGHRKPRMDKLKAIIEFAKELGISVTFFDFQ